MADREPAEGPDDEGPDADADAPDVGEAEDPETLREAVEAKYDFDDFRPADMAEMTVEEWEAAFDADTWITGPALIDRVEAELTGRVADGELFAVVERHELDDGPRLLVYSDAEYAVVGPDGSVDGEGALRREVEPVVALCSMDRFEVATPPAGAGLPDPSTIEPGSGDLGHRLLLAVAVFQLLAGLVLLVSPVFFPLGPGAGALTTVIGLIFVGVAVVLGVLVANARLSDRFRAAEYRERLEAAGVGRDGRPSFLPDLEAAGEAEARADEADV
ncbi:MAG: hypothetical protein U5J98_12245 [Halobacteriales archaeon]|nr:hypothetical protein [Halobacteriales archaeon]